MPEDSAVQIPASWKDRRKQQLRDELLEVALRLFQDKGVDATSVDDIVHLAGVAKGTFYLYFKSKADVVSEAVGAALGAMQAKVTAAIGSSPEDARVTLKSALRAQLGFLEEHKGMVSLLLDSRGIASQDLPEDVKAQLVNKCGFATVEVWERIIRTGMLQTHYQEVDAHMAAIALRGMLTELVYDAVAADKPIPGVEAVVVELLEKGIRRV